MILESLEANCSMKEACQQTGISYSKAWRILNTMEEQLGYQVVIRQHGGRHGGSCLLTASGQALMDAYREADKRIKAYAEVVFQEVMNVPRPLREVLNISPGDIISLTGAGGKTTALHQLGKEFMDERVLLTTTTKMLYPADGAVERICNQEEADVPAVPGRTFLYGRLLENGKCTAIAEEQLTVTARQYDHTIVEADGSKGLPLKGYRDYEPCIPRCATVNVGIATVKAIGTLPDQKNVHRAGRFRQMTGMTEEQPIGAAQIAGWISHPEGMFKGGRGRKVLMFNQIEDEQQFALVREVITHLDKQFLAGLERIVAGSLKEQEWRQM